MIDTNGAWIFVSHSSKDIAKVRIVRNFLERKGHNPLLFYLKCMDEDSTGLPDLIRREIGVRKWFVLCDSQSARASKWVQEELQIIKSFTDKVYVSVNLEGTKAAAFATLDEISVRATIYPSYSTFDRELVEPILAVLRLNDFRVLGYEAIQAGAEVQSEIARSMDEAIRDGFVLLFLSPASLKSRWVESEHLYALEHFYRAGKWNLIPIILYDAPAVIDAMPPYLRYIRYLDMTQGNILDNMKLLLETLKRRPRN